MDDLADPGRGGRRRHRRVRAPGRRGGARRPDRRDRGAGAARSPRRRRHRLRAGPGLHRHPHALGFHPAAQSARRRQDPPGRHHRGARQLRVLGGAGAGRPRRGAQGLPRRERAVAALPRDHVRRATSTSFPPTSVNTVMQVGHNTLRLMAMHMENRPAAAGGARRDGAMARGSARRGALGLSSGLFTAPGSYAGPEELTALGRVLGRHGGAYASHIRNEGRRVFEAVDEAVGLGERCGVHVQIAHLKVSGTENWGGARRLLGRIDAARRRGVRVDCDQYPYTTATNPLRNLFPVWIQDGGLAAMLERLRDRAACETASARTSRRGDTEASAICRHGTPCAWRSRRTSRSTPGEPSARSPRRAPWIHWTRRASTSWRTRGIRACS